MTMEHWWALASQYVEIAGHGQPVSNIINFTTYLEYSQLHGPELL